MKNVLLIFIVLIVALAGSVNAQGVLTYSSGLDYLYDAEKVNLTIASDTLAETDSTTLINKYAFEPGKEYFLVRNAITGTGSDSIKIRVRLDVYNFNSTFMYSTEVDTISAAAGEALTLPINKTVFAGRATVKGVTYTGNGGQVILNTIELWARTPYQIKKNY